MYDITVLSSEYSLVFCFVMIMIVNTIYLKSVIRMIVFSWILTRVRFHSRSVRFYVKDFAVNDSFVFFFELMCDVFIFSKVNRLFSICVLWWNQCQMWQSFSNHLLHPIQSNPSNNPYSLKWSINIHMYCGWK